MRYLLLALLLTGCLTQHKERFLIVQIKAGEGSYEQGVLTLRDVNTLATFMKEKPRQQKGNMSVEDFVSAWQLNASVADGHLSFAGRKKSVSLRLTDPVYSESELTIMAEPLESKEKIPRDLVKVELKVFIKPDEQPFWDKWMGF